MGALMNFFVQLLQIFCLGNGKQNQNQQQQHQYPQQGQQGGAWQGGQQGGAWQGQQGQQGGQSYPPTTSGGWTSGQGQSQGGGDQQQYTAWRNEARHEGDLAHKCVQRKRWWLMYRCFADSQTAYKSGNGQRAKELSVQGKQHQARQDELDDKASDWIFRDNNSKQPHGTIDLHGLYVKEAIARTEQAITDGQRSGLAELRVITGKGLHSQNHQAKIKPAVSDLMRKYNLSAHVDQHNAGVLVVDLQGRTGGNRSRDAGFLDQMDKDTCVLM